LDRNPLPTQKSVKEMDSLNDLRYMFDDLEIIKSDLEKDPETSSPPARKSEITQGSGLYKRRGLYKGMGIMPSESSKKYYLDIDKLKNNILAVKYRSSRNFKIHPTKISTDARELIQDIYEGRFNSRLFDQLNDADQAIVQLFIDSMNMQSEIHVKHNKLEELYYDFSTAKGQLSSGNNNPEIVKTLKNTIVKLMALKKIKKVSGLQALAEIALLT
jgi:hypothetical protein